MAEDKTICMLCNKKVRYGKRYNTLKAGKKVIEVACLLQLIKEKGWKVIKRGQEEDKDNLKPKKENTISEAEVIL